jgi:lupus La protein
MTEEVEIVAAAENGSQEENGGSQTNLSQLEVDIIRQIEYYFGESNLRRDKFLISKIAEDDEGWVPITVLLTFNRLKALSDDAKVIAECVEKSTHGLVQVSEDKEKIRRHPENPLPEFNEARRKEIQQRTAYAKGFPLDSVIGTILEFFNNNFENVENVVMRKYYCSKEKVYLFKGSVYILFTNKESAEEFAARPEIKYGEKELLRYMQAKYMEVKKVEKAKFDKQRKEKKGEKEEKDEIVLPKNTIVHFSGIEGDVMREDIKKKVAEVDPSLVIAFVHFERGNKEGQLRFMKENDGKKFLEQLEDGKV